MAVNTYNTDCGQFLKHFTMSNFVDFFSSLKDVLDLVQQEIDDGCSLSVGDSRLIWNAR